VALVLDQPLGLGPEAFQKCQFADDSVTTLQIVTRA